MVLVHDTSSRRGLQVNQVSLKIFNGFQVIEWTRFVADRRTDATCAPGVHTGHTRGQGSLGVISSLTSKAVQMR